MFTTQSNLVMKSGLHSSLQASYHRHINFTKCKVKVHYPPRYEWEVWHYQKANVDQITKRNNSVLRAIYQRY